MHHKCPNSDNRDDNVHALTRAPPRSIKSLVIFFGPALLPRAISYYQKARNAPRQQGLTIQPLPPPATRAVFNLCAAAALLILAALPVFTPENIFIKTQSRLQIPAEVLFNRLSTLRPDNVLTAADEALKSRFVNLESKLLYLKYGPEVLTGCTFCSSDDPRIYYFYALPSIAVLHLFNLFCVGLATSRPVSGPYGSPWRKAATMVAIALAGADVYLLDQYAYKSNALALRLGEIDFFYWRVRAMRLLALATLDGLLATALYLSATNRAFAKPPSAADRAESINAVLSRTRSKLNALGTVMNTVSRDGELRRRAAEYWVEEGDIMRGVMEEREVVESVNDALENGRLDIDGIGRDAAAYADNITSALRFEAEAKKQR